MATKTSRHESSAVVSSTIAEQDIKTRSRPSSAQWELKLSFVQLLTAWFIVAASMVGVFFFGLIAGQEEGLKNVLEEQAKQTVRFPIETSDITTNVTGGGELGGIAAKKLTLEREIQAVAESETNEQVPSGNAEVTFDFRKSRVVPDSQTAGENKDIAVGEIKSAVQKDTVSKDTVPKDTVPKDTVPKDIVPKDSVQISTAPEQPVIDTLGSKRKSKKNEVKAPAVVVTQPKPIEPRATVAIPSGWYVQVAAVESEAVAKGILSDLSKQNLIAYVQEAKVRKTAYFRVLNGPYPDRKQANAGMSKVKQLGLVKGEPFLKQMR